MISRRSAVAVLTLALVAGGCRTGPRALVPGEDACAYCRMTIDDVRFGALIITAKGRIQAFDSIECAASFVAALAPDNEPRAVWVADFEHPAVWVDAARAVYLHRSQLKSPMGRELAAFAEGTDSAALQQQHGGRVIAWTDVLTLVQASLTASHAGAAGARAH